MLPSQPESGKTVNPRVRDRRKRLLACHTFAIAILLAAIPLLSSCSHTKRALIFETTVPLPSGRFAGPIEVAVPRRTEGSVRDIEIRTELVAGCGPLLRMSYPDGELTSVGERNDYWQSLLARRAENSSAEEMAPSDQAIEESTATMGADPNAPVAPYTEPAVPPESLPAQAQYSPPASAQVGRWQRTTTESWPGQLEFMRWRDDRCSKTRRFKKTYTTAYDENGRVTIWAEVPQELAGAELRIRVYEITDVDREERIAAAERRRLRPKKVKAAKVAKVSVSRPAKPRPEMPKAKHESPRPATAEGAIWVAGQWQWSGTRGKWVWTWGHWNPPASQPALLVEKHGGPPVAGCTWQQGHWTWVPGKGAWSWVSGYWNQPPPLVEERGQPPVPESPWNDGRWQRKGISFEWIAGYWGKPTPRAESIPAPPYQGAHWRPGAWLRLRGEWVWSAGFYEQSNKPPPPRKREVAGASPMAGAVWLAGFWRWDTSITDYRWIAGHWETPPGEGYVWIPDPIDPSAGYSVGGQWKLQIDVNLPVEVRR